MSTSPWVTADELSEPQLPEAHEAALSASFLMWALSGRKYGGARSVVELYDCPCRCSTYRNLRYFKTGYLPFPTLINGEMYNVSCGGCGAAHRLRLRGNPIIEIARVKIRNQVINPDEFEIHDDVYLAPAAGASWSICQGVEVSYSYGVMPPEAGRRAARLLADELMKAKLDPNNCRLPDRVTSISRQGVSFTVLDPQAFLDEGRLGIYEVDAFLRAVNPDRARKPARVFSPDLPRAVRVRSSTPTVLIGPYDLIITAGQPYERVFYPEDIQADISEQHNWFPIGYHVAANSGATFQLEPYLSPAGGGPDDPIGSVRLSLPADVTASVDIQNGTYTINAFLANDDTTVIHLVTGRVHKLA